MFHENSTYQEFLNTLRKDTAIQFFDKALQEKAFVISELDTVTNSGTTNLHIRNPSSNDTTAIFTTVDVSTQFQGVAKVHENFSSITDGTSITIDNFLMDTGGAGAADSGNMEAFKNSTFTSTDTHSQTVLGSGVGASTVAGNTNLPLFAMEPGREIVIEITNQGSNSNDATILVSYFEIDEIPSDLDKIF